MKFGKYIRNNQLPKWSQYYLDYKFLKFVIAQCLYELTAPPRANAKNYLHTKSSTNGTVIVVNDHQDPYINTLQQDTMEQKLARYNNNFRSRTDFITAVHDEFKKVVEFVRDKKASLRLLFEQLEMVRLSYTAH